MQDRRTSVGAITLLFLVITVIVAFIAIKPLERPTEFVYERNSSIEFEESTFYINVTHIFDARIVESGEWYEKDSQKYISGYNFSILFELWLPSSQVNITDRLESDIFLLVNTSVNIFDFNSDEIFVYTVPIINSTLNLRDLPNLRIINETLGYRFYGLYADNQFFDLYPLNETGYHCNYTFSVQYEFVFPYLPYPDPISMQSDEYWLPFTFVVYYNSRALIPMAWYWISGGVAIGAIFLAIYKKRTIKRTPLFMSKFRLV